MLTQIYETSRPEEATALCAIGIDHVGVLVGDGSFPREQDFPAAHRIAAAIVPPARFCALFLTGDVGLIAAGARALAPAILHLGAGPERLGPEAVAGLRAAAPECAIMRSIPVTDDASCDLALSYDGLVDFLLLDSHRAGDAQIGALGVTHDWAISRRIVRRVRTPVILAGGIGPDNVAAAIAAVRPAGVDSKTRTDCDGSHEKDLTRVRCFHAAAKFAGLRRDDTPQP